MPYKKIKALIIDDSLFFQDVLNTALGSDQYIEIVGVVGNVLQAQKVMQNNSVDVITLDMDTPFKQGIDLLQELMPNKQIPIVLVSSLDMSVFEALQAGAIDFVKKPDMKKTNEFSSFTNELAVKVKIASAANIRISPPIPLQPNLSLDVQPKKQIVVAIGASTGGTEATLEVLKQLPAEFPAILVTQHMPAGFTKMYADRLNRLCAMKVEEAQNGMRVEPGLVIVAAGDCHMTLEKDEKGYYVKSKKGQKVSGHCPSVDVLFESVAKHAGANAIGVILTGMGRDGADGLLSMSKKGAYTIGQDKESSVVYGMPMVAHNIGAVKKQASIQNIAEILINQINKM